MKTLSSSGPAAQQFISEVSRILVEGNALQESDQEMTDRIAHAVSKSNVASYDGTGKSLAAFTAGYTMRIYTSDSVALHGQHVHDNSQYIREIHEFASVCMNSAGAFPACA